MKLKYRIIILITGCTALFILLTWAVIHFFFNHSSGPPPFLPGIYTSTSENEFCKIQDTLTISRISPGGDIYTITRRCSFRRIKEGRALFPEDQQDQWQAGYDEAKKCLIAAGKKDNIQYDPDANMLMKADFIYQKIE